ncbi:PEP-CTERM sorting domain-containing protein [Planctomycetales bacterium ZRK34]|nr:PEP-CTERM sorting domain-containing protein [Planctomycetales bacterium ZRK34]
MTLIKTLKRQSFAALLLALAVAPAGADTSGYWRGESDANGGPGLEILNEVAGNSLTAPSATIDTNPANLPVGRIPRTGAVNTGSIDGDANINGVISEYAALNSDSITVEVFSRTLEGGGNLITRTNNTDAGFSITDFSGYDVKYYVGAGTEVTINNVVNPNADWNYLAWTYDATEGVGRVYVDGKLAGTQATATPGQALNWTGAGDISVGFDMDGGALSSTTNTGIIDELRISNTALQTYQFLGAPALAVDFGGDKSDTTNQDVQTYFYDFSEYTSNAGGVGSASRVIDTPVGVGGQVTVSIDAEITSQNIDPRNRGDNSGDLSALLEDHFKSQNSGVELTIEGLEAGVYKMTSWHHEGGGSGDTGGSSNLIDIFVTDAMGSLRSVIDDLVTSGGNLSSVDPASATYAIYSDGINPITILFDDASPTDHETVLNGFQLLVIPEPASMAMLAAGSLMLMRRRRA